MKDKLKNEMLEAIFVQTGGREENPKIAELCAGIAVKFISANGILENIYLPSELIALKEYYDFKWRGGCKSGECKTEEEIKAREISIKIENKLNEMANNLL